MIQAPPSHVAESLKMEADSTVDLWEVHLRGVSTIIRFWNGPDRVWQGNTYNGLACQLQGEETSTDGKYNRPTLTVVNPLKIFGSFAALGYFDLAEVIRRRVLQNDFIANNNVYDQRVWIAGRVLAVMAQVLTVELRSTTDMPTWTTPRRTFSPPEFPFVVI